MPPRQRDGDREGLEGIRRRGWSAAGEPEPEELHLHPGERASCCAASAWSGRQDNATHLPHPPTAQDFAVFSISQLLGHSLRELDLTLCVNVTDLSVRSIATYLQRLVVLRLGWCKEITDWGLLGMVETTLGDPDQEMVRPASHSSLVVPSGPGPQL